MMGTQASMTFVPHPGDLTLDDLVPSRFTSTAAWIARSRSLALYVTLVSPDNLRRQAGRPSIDPVVFFKLQLIMFFEGICGLNASS